MSNNVRFLPMGQNEDPKHKAVKFFKKFGLPMEDVDDLVQAVNAARHPQEVESDDEDGEDGEADENNDDNVVDVC